MTLPDLDLPDRQHAITEYVQAPIDYIKQEDIARLGGRAKPLAAGDARMIAAIEQQSGVPAMCCLRFGCARLT